MHVGSESALEAWKTWDLDFLRYFNVAILTTKTGLKHQGQSSITQQITANILIVTH